MSESISSDEQAVVQKLEQKIDSVLSYLDIYQSEEAPFHLRELRDRYIPDTVAIYEAIPAILRCKERVEGKSAQMDFLEQIKILHTVADTYINKIHIDKNVALVKNRRFLEKIAENAEANMAFSEKNKPLTLVESLVKSPEIAPLTSLITPIEIIKESVSDKEARKYALAEFEKSDYGDKSFRNILKSTGMPINRPNLLVDHIETLISIASGVAPLPFVDTFLFNLHNENIFGSVLLSIGVDIVIFLPAILIMYTLLDALPLMKKIKYAYNLAWLITIQDASVAPGTRRKPEIARAMATQTFISAREKYKQNMNTAIRESIVNGRRIQREHLNAGVFV